MNIAHRCICPDETATRESEDEQVKQFGEKLVDSCRAHHISLANRSNKGDVDGICFCFPKCRQPSRCLLDMKRKYQIGFGCYLKGEE